MSASEKPVFFQIDGRDNVATALADVPAGGAPVIGDASRLEIVATEDIPAGHKIAVQDIAAGGEIVKYGVVIGRATKAVAKGAWVHLHCMESCFDEKSGALDPSTGTSRDVEY